MGRCGQVCMWPDAKWPRRLPRIVPFSPHFPAIAACQIKGSRMKKTIALGALALSLISSVAMADERRGGDAALGALSGAVVFGPIGAEPARSLAIRLDPRLRIRGDLGDQATRARGESPYARKRPYIPATVSPRRTGRPVRRQLHKRRRLPPRPLPPLRRSRDWSKQARAALLNGKAGSVPRNAVRI